MSSVSENASEQSSGTKNGLTGAILGGQWKLLHRLGKGGIGHVYEARHTKHERRVAIKLLRKAQDWDDESETIVDRFYHEAQILRRLQHPGIIDVYDFGFEEELGFYLVMELLEGQSLLSYMQKNTGLMPWKLLYTVTSQVCDAMGYAHERDIVHRDLKPEHIFLVGAPDEKVKVKVFDFGIARFSQDDEDSERLTQQGVTLGTPRYLSPEQTMGANIDHRSDIYTLCVILFELLTRRRVFQVEGAFQLMTHHAYIPAPTLAESRPDLNFPESLVSLIADGLAKEPDQRPQSMEGLKERLYQAISQDLEPTINPQLSPQDPSFKTTGSFYMVGGRPRPTTENKDQDKGEMDQLQDPSEIAKKLMPLSTPSPQPSPAKSVGPSMTGADTPLSVSLPSRPTPEGEFPDTPIPTTINEDEDLLSIQEFEDNGEDDELPPLIIPEENAPSFLLDDDDEEAGERTLAQPSSSELLAQLSSSEELLASDDLTTHPGDPVTLPPAAPVNDNEGDLDTMLEQAPALAPPPPAPIIDPDADPDTMLEQAPSLAPPPPQQQYPVGRVVEDDSSFAFIGSESQPSLANVPAARLSPLPQEYHAKPTPKPPTPEHKLSPWKPQIRETPPAHAPLQPELPPSSLSPQLGLDGQRPNSSRRSPQRSHRPKIRSAKYQDVLQKEQSGSTKLLIGLAIGLAIAGLIGTVIFFLIK